MIGKLVLRILMILSKLVDVLIRMELFVSPIDRSMQRERTLSGSLLGKLIWRMKLGSGGISDLVIYSISMPWTLGEFLLDLPLER